MIFMSSPGPALDCSICSSVYFRPFCFTNPLVAPIEARCHNRKNSAGAMHQLSNKSFCTGQPMLRVKQISKSAFNQLLKRKSKHWSVVLFPTLTCTLRTCCLHNHPPLTACRSRRCALFVRYHENWPSGMFDAH